MASPLQKIRDLFSELMGWTGEELIPVDFVMAAYLSPFLPGSVEKTWGDLCGPPASGKSEILRALEDGENRTRVVHNITPNAFSSAMRDENDKSIDYSLVHVLQDSTPPKGPKVLILPEMTSILGMGPERVGKFFGDMRAAYDGSFNNAAGNLGIDCKSDLNFGVLTACTEVMDEYRKSNQTLGERTMVCRIGRETAAYTARQKIADQVVQGDRLRKAVLRTRIKVVTHKALNEAIAHIKTTNGNVVRGESFTFRVGRLGAIATSLRTQPLSANSFTSLSEGPARLAQQLVNWGDCRVLFDGRPAWNEGDYKLVRRITQDTLHPETIKAIHALWRDGEEESVLPMEASTILSKSDVGQSFFRQLKQWAIIGILYQFDATSYALHPAFASDIKRTGFMEGLYAFRS